MRSVIRKWLSELPQEERRKLQSRLTDSNDDNFLPAFFELFLHALLFRQRHRLEIEPSVGHPKDQRPDFLAWSNHEKTAYVEATARFYLTKKEKGIEKIKAAILNSLECLEIRDLSIAVTWRQDPNRTASGNALRREISQWITGIDTHSFIREHKAGRAVEFPKGNFHIGGGLLNVTLIPFRGSRTISMESNQARWISSRRLIRSAIDEKGRMYGDLDAPFVIAINVREASCDRNDIIEALFGDQQVLIDREGLEIVGTGNALNGALFGKAGPRKQKVSAVLIFRDLQPWTIGLRDCVLVHNPFAHKQIPTEFLSARQLKVTQSGEIEEVEGRQPWSILGLNQGWPEHRHSVFSSLFDRVYFKLNRFMPLP